MILLKLLIKHLKIETMELAVNNLEELNLVELNVQEVQEVEGGTWPSIGWWMDCGFSYGGGGREIWT